ncbi:MAG: TetR/AcrR family transcriptional regulator [Actinomycetaceae bacterium]|nr:TetR/AcrR family transcriptional regulator [Actinomycetaceae bacterium]
MPNSSARRGERGPYAGGLARRDKILDVTVEMIAEVGYHGLSMRDVARRVGISHPGVIYHFPNKEALLMAVIDRYETKARFDVEAMGKLGPFDVFRSFLDLNDALRTSPTIVEMECMLSVEASSEIHPAHDHFAARFEGLQKVLTVAFEELDEEGLLISDAEPRDIAYSMLAQWYGLQIQWLYNPTTISVNKVLTQSLIGVIDMDNPKALSMALDSNFASPVALSAIEQASGKTLADLLDEGFIDLQPADLEQYGLHGLSVEMVERVISASVLTAEDLEYVYEHHSLSLDLLGRLVVGQVLDTEDFNTLAELEIVPADAVAALTAVMAARPQTPSEPTRAPRRKRRREFQEDDSEETA